jgi:hypothetical protein
MIKILGSVLIFIGLVFTFNFWRTSKFDLFLLQLLLGPTFIGLGLQLIK